MASLNSSAEAADGLEGMQRNAPLPANDRLHDEAQALPNCTANYQLPTVLRKTPQTCLDDELLQKRKRA
jgi:hypothetical protein